MATSAPLSQKSPEETNNPGQELADRELNPDAYQKRQATAKGDPTDPRGNDTAAGDPSDPLDNLREEENIPSDSNSYYKEPAPSKNRGFWRGPGKGRGWRRKRLAITAAVAAATAAASIAIFLSLIPLKILHIVNNLQSRFYSTSQNAIQKQTDNMFKDYVIKHVLPSYKNCGTTLSKDCGVVVSGTNPVSKLYKTWGNARLENKLAANYGIEFQKRPSGWYIKTPKVPDGINIGQTGENIGSAFEKAGISDIRQAVQKETRWYQVYFRFKVGSLLQEKYGVRRCLIFCSVTDPLANKVAEQKIAAKLFLTQRVLLPRNQTLGIALECLLSNCAADVTEPTNATPGVDGAENGAPENPGTDTAIRDGLTKLAANYGLVDSAAIDALVKTYTEMSEKGFQNYLITKSLAPIIGESTAGGFADKIIPIAGWIDLTARLINTTNDSSRNLKKLSYLTNATAAVALFSMYRTYADEIKSGHVDNEEVGSLVDSLGPSASDSATDPEVGGNVGAEATPLYGQLIDNKTSGNSSNATATLIDNIFSHKALAASSSSASSTYQYKCNDGNPLPAGKAICNEEILGIGSHYADLVHEFLKLPGVDAFTEIARIWRASVGQFFDLANSIFGSVFKVAVAPLDASCKLGVAGTLVSGGYCDAKNLANKYAPEVMNAVVQWLIPNPFSSNMSGGRTFDMMSAGADVAGNDSAHTTLGGQQLTDQQAAAIVAEQQNEELRNYKSQSFIAKMFDTNSNFSPVTKLAMAMPTSWTSASQGFAGIFTDPFNKLGSVFPSVLSPGKALAATAAPDPFGVVQYGYPDGTIPSDPETYWSQNCSDNAAYAYRKDNSWNQAAAGTLDSNHMPLNTAVNPCLLIMAAAGSDGGIYDSSLLTPDDLATSSSASITDSGSQTSSTAGASIDMAHLYDPSASVACALGTKDLKTQDGYHDGQKVQIRICGIPGFAQLNSSLSDFGVQNTDGDIAVNSRVSGAVLALFAAAKQDGITLQANSSFRTMAYQQSLCPCDGIRVALPGYSNHQMGLAIDFATLPSTAGPVPGNSVWDWLAKNAASFGYKNYPAEAWHWSPTGN